MGGTIPAGSDGADQSDQPCCEGSPKIVRLFSLYGERISKIWAGARRAQVSQNSFRELLSLLKLQPVGSLLSEAFANAVRHADPPLHAVS